MKIDQYLAKIWTKCNSLLFGPTLYIRSAKNLVAITDGEHAMMWMLHAHNIECPLPVINVHGAEKSLEKLGDGNYILDISLLFSLFA